MNIKKMHSDAEVPTKGSKFAAGYDLYAYLPEEVIKTIGPQRTEMIPVGIALEIPEGCAGLIFPRSGLATKEGLRLANCVAVIDSDYRGEVFVPLYNDSSTNKNITDKERIAQLVVMPFLNEELNVVEQLSPTERDIKGFGSSGK